MLSVKNLTYSPHNELLFKNMSATFNDGEIIGITGPAASGKSSFINLLKNKNLTYQGNIFINECNIREYSKKQLQKIISHYSSMLDTVNPEAIVKDWILSGRSNHKKLLSPYNDTDKEIAYKEMTSFGLENSAETKLKLISETYRRMASLAKVFSSQSEILLLEKPEMGLNINQKVLLSKNLKKYSAAGNKIIILTSADLNFIAASCDRIIILADDGIAETGTHKIITGELIKKYFHVETIVTRNIFSGLPEIQTIEEN